MEVNNIPYGICSIVLTSLVQKDKQLVFHILVLRLQEGKYSMTITTNTMKIYVSNTQCQSNNKSVSVLENFGFKKSNFPHIEHNV